MNTTTQKIRSSFKTFFKLFFSKFSISQKIISLTSFVCWGITLSLFFKSESSIGLNTLWYGVQAIIIFILMITSLRYFIIQVANDIYHKKVIKWNSTTYEEIEWEEFEKEMDSLNIDSQEEILSAKEYFEIKGKIKIKLLKYYTWIYTGLVSFFLASLEIFKDKLPLQDVILLYKFGIALLILLFSFLIITYHPTQDILNRESRISERLSELLSKYLKKRKFNES